MSVLSPSERADLRETSRRLLEAAAPLDAARRAAESGSARGGSWEQMAELGWLAMLTPERCGGLGWGYTDAEVILSELGRLCVAGPYVGTGVLAPAVLRTLPEGETVDRLLTNLASGERTATVSLTAPALGGAGLSAQRLGDGWQLDGEIAGVLDLPDADVVIAPTTTDDGAVLFVVDVATSGVSVQAQPTTDTTRRLGTLRLDQVVLPDTAVLALGHAAEVATKIGLECLHLAIAIDAAAGTRRVHELAVDFSLRRQQFGRPIGAFQVVQHRLADQYLLATSAAISARTAARALDSDPASQFAVSTAKAYATEAYARVANDAVLVHGAIGFTWEHDLHIYLKRALLDRELGGPPSWHRLRALAIRADLREWPAVHAGQA